MSTQFTPQQLTILKNALIALGGDVNNAAASVDVFNSASAVKAWSEVADCGTILEAVDFTAYTPQVKPATGDAQAVSSLNLARASYVAIKQMNLQTILGRPGSVDCTKAGIRKGIADAVTDLLAGNAGVAITAGAAGVTSPTATDWSTVSAACQRLMTVAENALRGALTAAYLGQQSYRMTWIGFVTIDDVNAMQ